MNKTFKKLATLLISLVLIGWSFSAHAAFEAPSYWTRPSGATYIKPNPATLTIGNASNRIPTGFFTNINVSGTCTGCTGASDVTGPASATDNAVVRFDSTTGKLVQNSVGILGDTGDFSGLLRTAAGNNAVLGGSTSFESIWDFEHTITDFSASTLWSPHTSYITLNPSSNIATTEVYGHDFETNVLAGNTRNIQRVQNKYSQAVHNGSGTVTNLKGEELYVWTSSSGPVTTQEGLNIASWAETTSTSVIGTNTALTLRSGHAGTVSGSIATDATLKIQTPYHAQTLTSHKGIDIQDQGFGTSSWSIYSAGGKVEFSAATGTSADFQLSGVDIAHGMTLLAPTNSFYRVIPLSGTAGGVGVYAMSDTDAQPYQLAGVFGTTTPTVTTPAVEVIGAKTNGTTGTQALASTEMIYKLSNNGTQVMKVMGDGRTLFGSGATVNYPLTLTNNPVGGTILGITPAAVTNGDILFFMSVPTVTGNIVASSIVGAVDGDLSSVVSNSNSSSGSARAIVESRVNGGSSGDPLTLYTVSGVTNWVAGIDNSNADSYSISQSSALGTNDVITLTKTPFLVGINKSVPTSTLDIVQTAQTTGSPTALTVTAGSHTTLTASGEVTDVNFNSARTIGISTGALATNRTFRFQSPTISMVGASTITNATTVDISAPPTAGNANTTILNPSALRIGSGNATFISNVSLNYGLVTLLAHTITLTGSTQVTTAAGGASALRVGIITLTDASAVTVDRASSFYVAGPVAQAGSVTITDSYAGWFDAGSVRFDGRILQAAGANLTAASTLTTGTDGTYFTVTGNTNVDYITTTGYTAGSEIVLYFTGTPTLNNNTGSVPANTAALQLSGSANFAIGAADANITLRYTGTVWQEVARTAF